MDIAYTRIAVTNELMVGEEAVVPMIMWSPSIRGLLFPQAKY